MKSIFVFVVVVTMGLGCSSPPGARLRNDAGTTPMPSPVSRDESLARQIEALRAEDSVEARRRLAFLQVARTVRSCSGQDEQLRLTCLRKARSEIATLLERTDLDSVERASVAADLADLERRIEEAGQ